MKNFKFLALIFLALSVSLFSCKKDKDEPAPDLPPSSTMVMNFGNFEDTTGNGKMLDTTKINFVHAATNVYWWSLVVTLHAVVPVAAFQEALNQNASYDSNSKTWTWEYNTNVSVWGQYNCRLEAKLVGSNVQWEMYISKSGLYTDFLWYSGLSAVDGTNGTWRLYQNPTSTKNAYMDILWHRNTNGTEDIKYTNIVPGSNQNGSYIEYGTTQVDPNYNAFYNIYGIANNNLLEVKWNTQIKEGRVKDGSKFNDADWHCWDNSFTNTTCTN